MFGGCPVAWTSSSSSMSRRRPAGVTRGVLGRSIIPRFHCFAIRCPPRPGAGWEFFGFILFLGRIAKLGQRKSSDCLGMGESADVCLELFVL